MMSSADVQTRKDKISEYNKVILQLYIMYYTLL